jgi:protein TonB
LPRPRLAVRVWRVRRRIGVLLLLSALLHVVLLVVLLRPARRPEPGAVSPPSFDLVMEPGAPLNKPGATRPTEIPAPSVPPAPPTPAAPSTPTAAIPPPAVRPPVAQPPPPPLPATTQTLPPAIPPAPVPQSAPPQADAPVRLSLAEPPRIELPPSSFSMPQPPPALPPTPAARRAEPAFPAPMDISLGRPVAPPPLHTSRGTGAIDLTIGRAVRESNGAPPRDTNAAEGMIHVRGANVGKDWLEQLHEWWERHSEYPQQAAMRGEDGTVQIHLKVDRYGRVQLVEIETRSGSQWLDMGALATFRGQQLPPFPPSTPEPVADLDITIDYILVGR